MKKQIQINLVETHNKEQIAANTKEMFDNFKAIKSENLRSFLFCAIDKDGAIRTGVLGSDMEIAEMLAITAKEAGSLLTQMKVRS
jgi:hypothetical protein